MKGFEKGLAALAFGAALVFGVTACGGASDPQMAFIPFGPLDGTQSTAPTQTDESQSNAEYNLIIEEGIANGTVFAVRAGKKSASKAVSGETVTVVMIANAGYELDTISVVAANGYSPQLSYLNVYAKTFVMPKQNVRVCAAFKALPAGKYSITPPTNVDGGSVTSNAASSAPGETVTLGATPDEGLRLDSWEVKDSAGNDIPVTGNTFVMPEGNVTITPVFVKIEYSITVEASVNGSVTASPTTATVGTVVTLTATPVSGCELSALAVTAEGGASVAVSGTGNSRTFTMPAKNVTVTAAFVAVASAASGAYTPAGTQTINSVDYELVTFGLWPQTIKASAVDVSDQCESKTVGDFTYYKGSDGQWYARIKENACASNYYTYSDGSPVAQSSANSYKWFKVEPIKWRVLSSSSSEKLLFAENILINRLYDGYNNFFGSSSINRWLNSSSGSGGFLKTAFADAEPEKIKSIYLFSDGSATNSGYGFVNDSTRIRKTTDFAKANGSDGSADGSGSWWLTTQQGYGKKMVHCVAASGSLSYAGIDSTSVGVVPALQLGN